MADDPVQDAENAGDPSGETIDVEAVAAKAAADADAAKAAADKGNGQDAEPIQYEAFQMPEDMEVDADALAAFTPLAQEFKLPQEKAQELANIMAGGLKKQADAHVKAWTEAMNKWRDNVEADKDIGGENLQETEKFVALALKKLGPPNRTVKDEQGNEVTTNPLQDILKITGVGNHVEIVRIFSKIGAILADDAFDFGRHLGDAPKTRAEILFPNQGQT